jgi:hypothetical protein
MQVLAQQVLQLLLPPCPTYLAGSQQQQQQPGSYTTC